MKQIQLIHLPGIMIHLENKKAQTLLLRLNICWAGCVEADTAHPLPALVCASVL